MKFSLRIWSIWFFEFLISFSSTILLSKMKSRFFILWKFDKFLKSFLKTLASFRSILHQSSLSSNITPLYIFSSSIGSFYARFITFELTKYGVIFHDTKSDAKFEEDLNWKMTWGIWHIFTRKIKSLKIGTLIGFFYPE